MESKQIVLIGLIGTALMTALVLSGWVADMVLAFVVLVAGILLTYYIALNQKRIGKYSTLRRVTKASAEIMVQTNLAAVLNCLTVHAQSLFEIENVLLWLPGDNITWPKNHEYNDLFADLEARVKSTSGVLQLTKRGKSSFTWPENVTWMGAYSLRKEGEFRGILLLLDSRKDRLQRLSGEMLNILCHQATATINRLLAEQEQKKDEQILIRALLAGTEAGDPIFIGHSERVHAVASLIGSKLGLDNEEMKTLHYAALLHDIGKYAETTIDPEDAEVAIDHATVGAELIPPIGIFKQVREAVRHHHERYDGSGYPLGLSKTDIPFSARIIAVADVYDAITHLCSEEEKLDYQTALGVIKKATGTTFDPLVVVALEEVADEVANLEPRLDEGEVE